MGKLNNPKPRKVNITYDEYLSILKAYSVLETTDENKDHLKNLKKLLDKIIGI